MTLQMSVRLERALTNRAVRSFLGVLSLHAMPARVDVIVENFRAVATHVTDATETAVSRRYLTVLLYFALSLLVRQHRRFLLRKTVRLRRGRWWWGRLATWNAVGRTRRRRDGAKCRRRNGAKRRRKNRAKRRTRWYLIATLDAAVGMNDLCDDLASVPRWLTHQSARRRAHGH